MNRYLINIITNILDVTKEFKVDKNINLYAIDDVWKNSITTREAKDIIASADEVEQWDAENFVNTHTKGLNACLYVEDTLLMLGKGILCVRYKAEVYKFATEDLMDIIQEFQDRYDKADVSSRRELEITLERLDEVNAKLKEIKY